MAKTRIEREKETVELMIRMYCRKKERNLCLCPECADLLQYACERLDHCPFGAYKSSCKHCSIHCYHPDMRKRMQKIMRWVGPRMFFYYPGEVIRHILGYKK